MSGYVHCACRDCMDLAIGEPGEFCNACIEAGCFEHPKIGSCMLCDDDGYIGRDEDLAGGEPCGVCGPGQHECLREDAGLDEVFDYLPEDNPVCPMDGGIGVPLGTLGQLEHFRCQNCGMDFSRPVRNEDAGASGKEKATP